MKTAQPPPAESRVSGTQIALPLVERISAIRSHNAARITWHKHLRFELLFLLDGATHYGFPKGRSVELPGGHFLIVTPNTMHRGKHDLRMPASLCGIVFDPRSPGAVRNSPFTRRDLNWMLGEFERHALEVRRMSPELRRLVMALSRQLAEKGAEKPLRALSFRLLACSALMEAARQLAGARKGQVEHAVAKAMAHMESHLSEPLPMSELAKAAGYGRARWFAIFKKSTGMTPNDYLQRLRIDKARTMLTESRRTVTDIAFAVGFSSSQYFNNVFRKYTGATPGDVRARVK